jgi:hypothetical protein
MVPLRAVVEAWKRRRAEGLDTRPLRAKPLK